MKTITSVFKKAIIICLALAALFCSARFIYSKYWQRGISENSVQLEISKIKPGATPNNRPENLNKILSRVPSEKSNLSQINDDFRINPDKLSQPERLAEIAALENTIESEAAIARLNSGDVSFSERAHYGKILERIVGLKKTSIAFKMTELRKQIDVAQANYDHKFKLKREQ